MTDKPTQLSCDVPEVTKRRRRRERNVDPSAPATPLPACRVCAEKSSGLHYGVNTCEACKVIVHYLFILAHFTDKKSHGYCRYLIVVVSIVDVQNVEPS